MPIRSALIACVLVLGTLAAVTSASAGDPYGGFGPSSDTATQEIGSDPGNDSPPTTDDQTLPWQQQQSQDQQNITAAQGIIKALPITATTWTTRAATKGRLVCHLSRWDVPCRLAERAVAVLVFLA